MHAAESADRVLGNLGRMDVLDEARVRHRARAGDLGTVSRGTQRRERGCIDLHARECIDCTEHVAERLDAHLAQQAPRKRTGRDARCGLACTRALERAAAVVGEPLHAASQVRMAGARLVNRRRAHRVIDPAVSIDNLKRHRRAERDPLPHARQDPDAIGLDALASATTVTALAPGKLSIDPIGVHAQAGGQTLDQGDEGGTVGLAGSAVAERHGRIVRVAKSVGRPGRSRAGRPCRRGRLAGGVSRRLPAVVRVFLQGPRGAKHARSLAQARSDERSRPIPSSQEAFAKASAALPTTATANTSAASLPHPWLPRSPRGACSLSIPPDLSFPPTFSFPPTMLGMCW